MHLLSPTRALTAALPAHARQPATASGPGRITRETATMCEVGIGAPVNLKFQVSVEALAGEDKERLSRRCKLSREMPRIVTVRGDEMDDPMTIKAAEITLYN